MEVRDYNGVGPWSRNAILERYRTCSRDLGILEPSELRPHEHTEGEVKWIYPVMDAVIPLIERGDPAAVALGVELVEEDQLMPFGRILKANTALRRTKLSPEQVERIRRRVVGLLVAGTIRRKFRQYAKLLRHVGLGNWWPEIEHRIDRKNPYAMRISSTSSNVPYLKHDDAGAPRAAAQCLRGASTMKPEIRKGLRTIVASREFSKRAGSKSARVRIEIGTPQHLPAEPGLSDWWACPIRIRGLGKQMLAYSGGVDGLQTLELALRRAGEMLSATRAFGNGELYWGKTPLMQDLDFALPLSLARLQSAVELTLSMLRKRRKSLSREAERGFTEMLEEAVRSLATCATRASASSNHRPQRRHKKPSPPRHRP